MRCTITLAVALAVLAGRNGATRAEEKSEELARAIDLGPVGDAFEVVSAEEVFDPARGGTLTLKLRAKKDVDTSQFFLKAGFFDKDLHLHLASPVRFEAAFPLKRGESIQVVIGAGRMQQKWHKIVLRKLEKPVPRSEYHYQ